MNGPASRDQTLPKERLAGEPLSSTGLPPPQFLRAPAWHKAAELLIRLFAISAIAAIILIIVFVAREAAPIFTSAEVRREVTLATMWLRQTWPGYEGASYIWQPVSDVPKYSVVTLLFGTLKVTFIAMLFAAPLGIASALFVAHFAPHRVRELVKPLIELLADVPSVVLGELVEFGETQKIFHDATHERTREYVAGKFG